MWAPRTAGTCPAWKACSCLPKSLVKRPCTPDPRSGVPLGRHAPVPRSGLREHSSVCANCQPSLCHKRPLSSPGNGSSQPTGRGGVDLHGNVCLRRRNDVTLAVKRQVPESTGCSEETGKSLLRGLSLSGGPGQWVLKGRSPPRCGMDKRNFACNPVFVVLGMESRAACVPGNCFSTGPHPSYSEGSSHKVSSLACLSYENARRPLQACWAAPLGCSCGRSQRAPCCRTWKDTQGQCPGDPGSGCVKKKVLV